MQELPTERVVLGDAGPGMLVRDILARLEQPLGGPVFRAPVSAGASPPGAPVARLLLGIAGAPGAGKSTLASVLASALGPRAAWVPMDGFHLADRELARQGLLHRKGAPETFDAWGYAALLQRLRHRESHPVYAPAFDRELEQPLAGAIAVAPTVDVVVTEGNYLLLDAPPWRTVRSWLGEAWFVSTNEDVRRARLLTRHVTFGKTESAAARWVEEVDEPNARRVTASAGRADRVIDVAAWRL